MPETSDVSKPRFYVYILQSRKDNGFYIGYTKDLKNRLTLHSKGMVYSTRNRRPVKLIHYEYFINQDDAKAREKYLKSGYGRMNFKEMLKRTLTF